jgi:hypothetical protein
MALGSVKEKMISIETLGANIKYINQQTTKDEFVEEDKQ